MILQPLSAEKRAAVEHDCEILARLARQVFRREIRYDEDSIKWLAWLIEFSRNRPQEQVNTNLKTSIGCFLGETIIARYGGEWVVTQSGDMGVRLRDQTVVFPFVKVAKQFKNGNADSIWGMFKMGDVLLQKDSHGAAPNGGPSKPLGSSDVGGGPPSVS